MWWEEKKRGTEMHSLHAVRAVTVLLSVKSWYEELISISGMLFYF
jgi:hypothetical protein